MTCDDAKSRSMERALGELEGEEWKSLEEHLAICAGCRATGDLDLRTVTALRTLDPVEPSEARRERAVAAMVAARAPRVTRRRWVAAAVAAAMLLALAVPLVLKSEGLSVERLDGSAWLIRGADGEKISLKLGDRLRPGDRLKTEGVVALQGADRLKVVVHRDSEVVYIVADGSAKIRLEKGAVRVDAPEKPFAIEDSMDRRAVVRGSCEARFSSVGGYPNRPEFTSGFQIHVKKGDVQFESRAGTRGLSEGQTMTVTDEGTIKVDDPPSDPGRNQK